MKKKENYTGKVIRVDFPNKGIVEVDNETCVIKNVIPGQTVEFTVTKKRGGKAEGRIINVVEKAPEEIDSPCPHFEVCGGCTYMNLPYEEQLKMKASQIKRLLDNAIGDSYEWEFEGIKGSPTNFEYRNKMEFSFGDSYKGGPLALGMHKRGSFYDIETVSDCMIVDEDYRKILNSTCDYFAGGTFYHKLRHEGYLRHLLVRKAHKTGEILIALVTSSDYESLSDEIKEKAGSEEAYIGAWKDKILKIDLTNGKIKGILHIINDSLADVVTSDRTDVLYGDEYINEELLGLKFKISTFSFFQTNSPGAEVLYSVARDYIGNLKKGEEKVATVFDLYSGTGTIAQLMADVSKKVIGVEIVEEAVEAAKENALINGLDNCEFIAGDVLKVLDDIKEKPDFIILDPPRDGVNPKALKKIIDYGVDRLIYISCKPTSLARDLEFFHAGGYKVVKASCVDMFPNTANIEVATLLERVRNSKEHVQIGIDAEDYYRIKDSEKKQDE